jgi:hypothetical protein
MGALLTHHKKPGFDNRHIMQMSEELNTNSLVILLKEELWKKKRPTHGNMTYAQMTIACGTQHRSCNTKTMISSF